jgi:hypothetical protein
MFALSAVGQDEPTLVEYIIEYRKQGKTDAEIRKMFIETYGDDPAAVDAAFKLVDKMAEEGEAPPPKKQPKWLWPVVIGGGAAVLIGLGALALRGRRA